MSVLQPRVTRALATRALLLAAAVVPIGAPLAAQTPGRRPASVRLVAFTNEPREPELGEVFALNLQVRMAPGLVVFLPDTLLPAPDAVSAGAGTWELGLAPADSVDVRMTYPVMGLDPGGVELPSLEIWIRPAASGESAGPRSLASLATRGARNAQVDPATVPGLERVLISIGGALIMPMSAMVRAADEGLTPRPPADVLGGQWSPWAIAAAVILAAGFALLAWVILARRGSRVAPLAAILSPRAEALQELDRVLASGRHTNGQVVEFYDATTGALRRFADRTASDCGVFLTSTELLGRLGDRWGESRVGALRDTVWSAERVKFGSERPAPPAAEADWAVVRSWIEGLPEGG